ncbi:hypothetical protein BJX62DRAFT_143151 [Aspergillus germanicus]
MPPRDHPWLVVDDSSGIRGRPLSSPGLLMLFPRIQLAASPPDPTEYVSPTSPTKSGAMSPALPQATSDVAISLQSASLVSPCRTIYLDIEGTHSTQTLLLEFSAYVSFSIQH